MTADAITKTVPKPYFIRKPEWFKTSHYSYFRDQTGVLKIKSEIPFDM